MLHHSRNVPNVCGPILVDADECSARFEQVDCRLDLWSGGCAGVNQNDNACTRRSRLLRREAPVPGMSRQPGRTRPGGGAKAVGGLAGWLLQRLGSRARSKPRLALLERITLAPRQTLSLVEADGRKLLVATSPDGAAAFYSLDEPRIDGPRRRVIPSTVPRARAARTSW